MKMTALGNDVLVGQGAIGSSIISQPNPAPPEGPAAGDLGHEALSIPNPDPPVHSENAASYGPSTFMSQYDTIKPIPEG